MSPSRSLLAGAMVALGHRWSGTFSGIVGVGLVAWIIVQMALLQRYFFLQLVIATLGVAELALLVAARRRPGAS